VYDWSAFPPTLLATVTGASFAAGTSWLLAWRASKSRHKEVMSERLRAVVESVVAWNASERKRLGSEIGDNDATWTHQPAPDEAKVGVAAAVMLLVLEAGRRERDVAKKVRAAMSRLDHLDTPIAKANAMARVNEILEQWWTHEIKAGSCKERLDRIASD